MKEDCRKIQSLLIDFADKNLDEENTSKVKAHLEKCRNCSNELGEISEIFDLMKQQRQKEPPAEMRDEFLEMLGSEKQKLGQHKDVRLTSGTKRTAKKISLYRMTGIAAAIALLIAGFGMGYFFQNNTDDAEVAALRKDLNQMQQEVMLLKLQEDSPSQRIQAASYIENASVSDPEIIKALKSTASNDENANVRQAALYALYRLEAADARDFFLKSLEAEKNPLVQISLIGILVSMNEQRAIEPLKNILYDNQSMDVVKMQAKKGLEVLV